MKKLLIFLILVFIYEINSQVYLQGQFVLDIKSPMHGENYIFNKNGTFEYNEWSDLLPKDYGRGNYEIQDSILILNYFDIPEMHDTMIYIDKVSQLEGDTVKYDIQLFDFKTKLPIQYGSVRLWYENNNRSDRSEKNVFLIQDYIREDVFFLKKDTPNSIQFRSLAGEDVIYNVYDSLSRNMRVYIKDMAIALDYIGPKQEKIPIRKITNDSFELYKYKEWCPYEKYSK